MWSYKLDIPKNGPMLVDLKDYKENGTVFKRTAVRGIIVREGKYLLIHSKYGEYKFPGGGKHEDENLIDTLRREVAEETGYLVKHGSEKLYREVLERRKADTADIMEMISYYYFCEVEEEAGERNLDDYEADYDYQVKWCTLKEAIEKNKQLGDITQIPWVVRDTVVMEKILEEREGVDIS